MTSEIPLTFAVEGATLIGVLHRPARAPRLGLILVVGGPQYRVGAHRQFLLLARHLASRGVAVLRFDCRGMGDSAGEFPGFENIAPDVAAAIDVLAAKAPSVTHFVLWGLCDATLAICECAARDSRISGVVLLNPWVRTETSQARAQLRHYYFRRLTEKEFYLKLARGKFDFGMSARSFLGDISRLFAARSTEGLTSSSNAGSENQLAQRLAMSIGRFRGPVLLVLSGRDLTAKEFEQETGRSKRWQKLYGQARFTIRRLDIADHTFSRRVWRDQIADWTWEWMDASLKAET